MTQHVRPGMKAKAVRKATADAHKAKADKEKVITVLKEPETKGPESAPPVAVEKPAKERGKPSRRNITKQEAK